jgi:F-type H+-transporting ATPase subunit epsilon
MSEAAENFDFELVSPEKKLMSEKVWQVTIPGLEGDFGVRQGHSSLVAAVRPGVVEITTQEGDEPQKIFITGGFADVTATNCTVLAEEATPVSDMTKADVDKEITDLQRKLDSAKDDIEKSRYTKQLTLAKARLTALTGEL